MHNAGNIAEQRENNIDPEMFADADLQKDTHRRQEDGADDFDKFHAVTLRCVFLVEEKNPTN